jgi:hypothetical protein
MSCNYKQDINFEQLFSITIIFKAFIYLTGKKDEHALERQV